jgi:hypothetical protein
LFAKLNGLKGVQAKTQLWFKTRVMASRKTQAIFLVAVAAIAVVLGPVTVAAIGGSGALPPVGFSEDRAMGFEQSLVSMGPRYSGTANEANTAEFVASEFTKAGLKDVKTEDYERLLWEPVTAQISIVPYGPLGLKPSLTQSPISFEHKKDFVVQGFSGSRSGGFRADLIPFFATGNGDNVSDFSGGSGRACIVEWKEASIAGNWVIFNNSYHAGCAAILAHNKLYAPELNYTPISKGVPAPMTWPDPNYPDIPFAAMSKDMGDQIKAHASWKVRINFDITIETRLIHVVTGDVKGTVDPAKFVMIGAHMDNVYVNNGAVDDGVGTTTILELAHQLAAQTPKYTIRLATFAGEEQGLWGSQNWRDAHIEEINTSMIAMFQFDMNHIDVERCSDMNFYTNDNTTLPTLQQSEQKVRESTPSYQKFVPHVEWADVSHMGSDMASFAAVGKSAYFAYGCGSWEYHTYLDDINRVTMPSLAYSGRVFASMALWLANK